jgi:hypothetical protein
LLLDHPSTYSEIKILAQSCENEKPAAKVKIASNDFFIKFKLIRVKRD